MHEYGSLGTGNNRPGGGKKITNFVGSQTRAMGLKDQ